jgi:hypothetical protein
MFIEQGEGQQGDEKIFAREASGVSWVMRCIALRMCLDHEDQSPQSVCAAANEQHSTSHHLRVSCHRLD